MKTYTKLKLPKDSAWQRRTIKRHLPIWFKSFLTGVGNIIRWAPTIYKDRDWDDWYVLQILKKKIEFQREHLVKENRHTNVDQCNFWMTVCLNLIERCQDEYYGTEYFDYFESKIEFVDIKEKPNSSRIDMRVIWEDYKSYLNKYPSSLKAVLKEKPEAQDMDDMHKCFCVSQHRQTKCNNLLFEILKRKSQEWWD